MYFINPPLRVIGKSSLTIEPIGDGLNLVTPTLPIPDWVRFKLRGVYDRLVTRKFRKLIKTTGKPDILWNFDNETYFKQEALFRDITRIFHPVDHFDVPQYKNYRAIYDFAFSVSPALLELIEVDKKYYINHGLNQNFVTLAEKYKGINRTPTSVIDGKKKAGYVGNLSIRFMDKEILLKTVSQNPDVEFHFVGNHEKNDSFIDRLKKLDNTRFPGVIRGEDLYKYLRNMDVLFACYKQQHGYLGDNSHKIMEYLSTGVPIVSSWLSVYKDSGLINMSEATGNESFPELFSETIKESELEGQSLKRMNFALSNSYSNQVDRIESHLH